MHPKKRKIVKVIVETNKDFYNKTIEIDKKSTENRLLLGRIEYQKQQKKAHKKNFNDIHAYKQKKQTKLQYN